MKAPAAYAIQVACYKMSGLYPSSQDQHAENSHSSASQEAVHTAFSPSLHPLPILQATTVGFSVLINPMKPLMQTSEVKP